MHTFLIRHGETTGDLENRYGGAYDDHLTEKGKAQAEALAEKLRDKDIEIIFSSPSFRARETTEILAKKIGCPVMYKEHLKERDQYGILTGMNREEAKKLHSDLVLLVEDRLRAIAGTESYENFRMRIQLAVREITMDSRHDCAAVVFHGGPMRVLFREILKKGEIKGDVSDCGFVELEKTSEGLKSVLWKGSLLLHDRMRKKEVMPTREEKLIAIARPYSRTP